MIAAIATGVLGQVEGAINASGGLSAITDLFANKAGAQPAATATPTVPSPHGHGGRGSGLSDQLQALLLQQQSVDTTTDPLSVQDDTTGGSSAGGVTASASAGTSNPFSG